MCIRDRFEAARSQLVREIIKPALERGVWVISDRFHDSTTAYQGYGRGLPLDMVHDLNKRAIGDVLPDMTIPVSYTHLKLKRLSK